MQTMASEKPHLGRSRIHGELLKLGFSISERTVSRYLSRSHRNGNVDQRWRTFLKNHREAIAGMDFFFTDHGELPDSVLLVSDPS